MCNYVDSGRVAGIRVDLRHLCFSGFWDDVVEQFMQLETMMMNSKGLLLLLAVFWLGA